MHNTPVLHFDFAGELVRELYGILSCPRRAQQSSVSSEPVTRALEDDTYRQVDSRGRMTYSTAE